MRKTPNILADSSNSLTSEFDACETLGCSVFCGALLNFSAHHFYGEVIDSFALVRAKPCAQSWIVYTAQAKSRTLKRKRVGFKRIGRNGVQGRPLRWHVSNVDAISEIIL
jgi:hypothetical protein